MTASYADERNHLSDSNYQGIGQTEGSSWFHGYIYDLDELVLVSDELFEHLSEGREGLYSYAVAILPESKGAIRNFVDTCTAEDSGIRYAITNAVSYELNTLDDVLGSIAGIFRYVGIGLALFAAIMLFNFISVSITQKKKQIGIMRALGARGADILRIFLFESFFVAAVNAVLSCLVTGITAQVGNMFFKREFGISFPILNFGIRQVIIIFLLSFLVAAISCIFPVRRIASKKPIDSIKG